MKKYVTISLFIFWAIVTAVIVAGLITYNKNNSSSLASSTDATSGQQTGITGVDPKASALALSSAELAKHNSAQSCWLLISGKIYDVTSFIRQHPGGARDILATCGTDATAAYASRGGTGSHSSSATSMLAGYYIGDLNQTVSTSPAKPGSPAAANPNPVLPQSRGEDDEFDD